MKKLLGLMLVLFAAFALFACGGHKHDLEKHAAKEATAEEAGNLEYWTCKGCDKIFKDGEAKEEFASMAETVVAPKGHTYSELTDKVNPTCEEAGNVAYYVREDGLYVDENYEKIGDGTAAAVVIPAAGHKGQQTKAKAADCINDGNIEYYTCSVCKKLFSDAECTTEITEEDTVVANKGGHTLVHHEAAEATDEVDGNVEYWQCSECNSILLEDDDKSGNYYSLRDVTLSNKATYTMHDFLASTTSLQWNPLTWETNDDSAMLGYVSSGFYDYLVDVDDEGNSLGKYRVINEMAAAFPEDVTEEYVGQFGVQEGETAKAWRIALNQNAKWQNGDDITADDYIYSMQQQLDSVQLNRRADSYYGGDFSIVNAQSYLYSGKVSYVTIGSKKFDLAEQAVEAGNEVYIDCWGFWGAKGYTDAQGNECPQYVLITDETVYGESVGDAFSGKSLYEGYLAETAAYSSNAASYCYLRQEFPVTTWEQVGLIKVDDYTIDIIIENSLENPTFYLPYYLSSTWLVHEGLYETCWTTAPDGTRSNTYGTSVETTMSYGPYKLVSYETDKQLVFTQNENWYGYTDDLHVVNGTRLYQTTDIVIDVISGHQTQLLAFLSGKVDAIGLQSDDMDEYGNSEYKLLTPQSYTTKLTFNTDLAALKERETAGINKTMLTNQKFRHALALSFDRADFCSQFTAGHTAGFGLYNYMYQYFNTEGNSDSYRNTDAAKDALVRVYGLAYGEDEEYETLDEAYKAITGYDPAMATLILKQAIEEAKATNLWNGTDTVSLEFTVYQADTIYTNMFNFFKSAVEEIAKGTELEGKLTMTMKVDDDYYNTMYAGKTDIIFSTWGGATYGTLGMMSNVYCDDYTGEGNQMEVGFDTSKVMVVFTLDEETGEKTYSLKAWADWLNNKANETGEDIDTALGKAADFAPENRVELLAELEYTYLNSFVNTPIYYRQTVSLHSMKISYAADEYIDLVGFGGLSQITYNFTDSEWNQYVASQHGKLSY